MMNKFKLLLPVFLLATAATASIDTPTIQNDQYTKVFDTTTHKIPDNIKDIANNISNYVNTNYSIEHLKTIFPEEDFLKFKEELMNSTTDIRREILEALSYDEFIENQHNNLSGFASHISEEADTMLLIRTFKSLETPKFKEFNDAIDNLLDSTDENNESELDKAFDLTDKLRESAPDLNSTISELEKINPKDKTAFEKALNTIKEIAPTHAEKAKLYNDTIEKLDKLNISEKFADELFYIFSKLSALASHLNDIIKNITENEFIIDAHEKSSDGIIAIKQDIQLKIASKILESKGITPITATLYLG